MDERDLDFDDVTDTSESSESEPTSSSGEGLFKGNIPYVLELHDITKDDPSMPPGPPTATDPLIGPAAAKIKKHRKKKKASDAGAKGRRTSLSMDSASDASSVAPSSTDGKEQFYDARESFHVIPENEVPTIAQVVTQSETIQEPKAPDLAASSESQSTTPTTQKEQTPIIKPTAPP